MDPYSQRTTFMERDRRSVRIMTDMAMLSLGMQLGTTAEAWVTHFSVVAGDNSLGITRLSQTQEAADKEHTDFVYMAFLMGFDLRHDQKHYRRGDKRMKEDK